MENNKMDKLDVLVSIASGALTAVIDGLFVKDLSLEHAHEWGKEETDKFVISVARSKGYQGSDISGAIRKLEDEAPFLGDELTSEFGGGAYHHLRDFSHHPTPTGLLFSILMQFTGKGYGTDPAGKFVSYEIKDWKATNWATAVYNGTITWAFHMISDIAGSSGTRAVNGKEGTGLPGPLMSFFEELASIPGVRQLSGKVDNKNLKGAIAEERYNFPVTCSKLFTGTLLGEHDPDGRPVLHGELRFDLRTELGIAHDSLSNKQYIPVVLNEVIVASFYSVRRFINEIKINDISEWKDLKNIDIKKCLPWGNSSVRNMRMISTATFSTIDITWAGIKAYAKNKENPAGFALDFMQGINYWGLGSLAIATNAEAMSGMKALYNKFSEIVEQQKERLSEAIPGFEEMSVMGKKAITTSGAILKIGTPIGFISASIGVYEEISKSLSDLKLAKEERIQVEALCSERVSVLREHRENINAAISEYMAERLTSFSIAFETMEAAIVSNDVDGYIFGNNIIQDVLGKKAQFANQEEFDSLMLSDAPLSF